MRIRYASASIGCAKVPAAQENIAVGMAWCARSRCSCRHACRYYVIAANMDHTDCSEARTVHVVATRSTIERCPAKAHINSRLVIASGLRRQVAVVGVTRMTQIENADLSR